MKERDRIFFLPLWRRVAVVTVCAVWSGLELLRGEQLWIAITAGLTVYSVWVFFITFKTDPPVVEEPTQDTHATGEKNDVPPQT